MAVATITPVKIGDVNMASPEITLTAVSDTTNGGMFTANGKDFKTAIIVKGGATAGKLKITAGNGIQGVNDIEIDIPKTNYTVFTLDSGSFKNVSGTNKGKILMIPTVADLTIGVVELP